jgi:hypothetical protein
MAKLKKGPLSKAESYYIDGHYRDMTAADIATDLNRTITSVENYIKKTHVKQKPVTGTVAGDHFEHHRGTTIMTENASTMADAKRKVSSPSKTKCVTKIK